MIMQTRLLQLRKEFSNPRLTQEKLAQAAGISRQWLHSLETGKRSQTSYTTATSLLQAINTERLARNLQTLTLDQLNLKIV